MMKPMTFCLLLFLLSSPCLLPAFSEGEGKADFDRQTERLAAKLQMRTYQEDFFRTFPAEAEEFLLKEMKENPRRHRNMRHSAALAKKQLKQFAGTRFRSGAEERLACYQTDGKALAVTGEKWDKAFDRLFSVLYPSVRTRAAMAQRKAMLPVILPDGAVVEKSSDEALKREISRRFAAQIGREIIWEENEAFFRDEMLPKIISTAREQQKTQLLLLKEIHFPLESWETKEIELRFHAALERAIAVKYPDPLWRYPIFPATEKEISRRAGRASYEKVIHCLTDLPVPGDYEKKLTSSPASHRIAAESFRREEEKWLPAAVASAMKKAGVPVQKSSLIAQDGEVKACAKQEFARRFIPEGKKIRARFAEKQAKRRWPELFSSWQPEMEKTEWFLAGDRKKIPAFSARPDGAEIIEETDALFDRLLREKLTAEAERLRQQENVVSSVYDEVFRTMEKKQNTEKDSFLSRWFGIGGRITLSAVAQQYEKQVTEKSSVPLFPSVKKEIEMRSRAILQQMDREEEKKQKEETSVLWNFCLEEKNGELFVRWDNFSCQEKDPRRCAGKCRKEMECRMKEASLTSVRVKLTVSGEATRYGKIALFREELRKFPEISEVQDLWDPSR